MTRQAEYLPPKAPDVVLTYQGFTWNAEPKTREAQKFFPRIRFIAQHKQAPQLWIVPTWKIKTFLTLCNNKGLVILTIG